MDGMKPGAGGGPPSEFGGGPPSEFTAGGAIDISGPAAVADQPRQFFIQIWGTTPNQRGARFIEDTFVAWMRANANRDDRPYKILEARLADSQPVQPAPGERISGGFNPAGRGNIPPRDSMMRTPGPGPMDMGGGRPSEFDNMGGPPSPPSEFDNMGGPPSEFGPGGMMGRGGMIGGGDMAGRPDAGAGQAIAAAELAAILPAPPPAATVQMGDTRFIVTLLIEMLPREEARRNELGLERQPTEATSGQPGQASVSAPAGNDPNTRG
jgi:hypothetical protein